MKKLCFFLLLSSFCTLLAGQSTNWEKSSLPSLVSIKARFQTSLGFIIGYHNDTKEWFITQSNGIDWSPLPLPITDDLPVTFKEDKDGFVYCAHQNILYRLILNKILVTNYYTTDSIANEDILDYSFQTNGDLIVATKTTAKLVSNVFVLKKVLNWPAHEAVKFIEGSDGVKYIVRKVNGSSTIASITKDLVISPTAYPIDEFEGAFVQNNRIFTRRSFSDNGGLAWNQFAFANEVALFCNGLGTKVFYATNKELFVSKNNGTDFSKINLPEAMDFLSANKADDLLMSSNSCEKPLYSSDNDGNTWGLIPSKQDLDYHYGAISDHNSNLLLNHCAKLYKKGSTAADWALLSTPNVSNVIALSNGSLLGIDASDKFKVSFNNGQSWNFLNTTTSALPQGVFCEKSKLLINVNVDYLQYSFDFGLTWKIVDNFLPHVERQDFAVGRNLTIVYYGNNWTIYEFDLEKQKQKVLWNPTNWVCPRSLEFNAKTGSYYYCAMDQSGKVDVLRSGDNGKSFAVTTTLTGNLLNTDQWDITTDSYGNVVVYCEQAIYLSTDDGVTFQNITPFNQLNFFIKKLFFSADHFLYAVTGNLKLFKYSAPLNRLTTIKLVVYDDVNKNCAYDPQDQPFGQVKYTYDKVLIAETDTNGVAYLNFVGNTGLLDFGAGTADYQFCTPQVALSKNGTSDTTILKVPVLIKNYCMRLESSLSASLIRRCVPSTLSGRVRNLGTIRATSCRITIKMDTVSTFVSASLPVISLKDKVLVLDGGAIQGGAYLDYEVQFTILCTVPNGYLNCFTHFASSQGKPCIEKEDEKTCCYPTIGSYDPNDKTLFANGKPSGASFEIGDKLEYQIRFQNTGNDTAFHVRIEDPISSRFNISSLRPKVASHAFRWKVENRKLIVDFDNIMLVDSFKNEPLSHGFVNFSIELDAAAQMGDVVENQAYIYFDFNDPILTNNVVSKIASKVSVVDLPQFDLLLAPNPTSGLVYLMNPGVSSQQGLLTVFNSTGESVYRVPLSENLAIDLSQQPAGFFVCVVQTRDSRYIGKVLKH